jgi:hypothetical protein
MCAFYAQPGVIKSEFIYETAPFGMSCLDHRGNQGRLIAAWFVARAAASDVGIWVSRCRRQVDHAVSREWR